MPQSAPFTVNLELALSGKGAPPSAAYDQALAKSAAALDWLRQQHTNKSLELLGIPSRTDDLRAAAKQAAALKGFATVAVLGIGGSSLGGQALTALRKVSKPFVEFHDNPDPFSWAKALKRFDLKKTHFIAISKSGGTAETLMQVLTAADALEKLGVKSLKKHFTIITEPHQSALADFADSIGAVKLDHPWVWAGAIQSSPWWGRCRASCSRRSRRTSAGRSPSSSRTRRKPSGCAAISRRRD